MEGSHLSPLIRTKQVQAGYSWPMMVGMSVLAQSVTGQPALLAAGEQNRPNGLGILCCLGALLVVLAIVIINRNRRGRGDRGSVD